MNFFKIRQPLGIFILLAWITLTKSPVYAVPPPSSQEFTPLCPADLNNQITSIIQRPEWQRSRWGILIKTLNSQDTLYTLDADKYFIPASNTKLLTTAGILFQLGSQFRIRTAVYGEGNIPHLTRLIIVPKGDPSLNTDSLKSLVQQLKLKGVSQIDQLILEDSYFKENGINSTWEWDDLPFYYAPSINSAILNENAVTLTLSPQQENQPLQVNWSDPIAGKQWIINNLTKTTPKGTADSIKIQGVFGQSRLEIIGELGIDAQPDISSLAIVDPDQYFLDTFQNLLEQEKIRVKNAKIEHKSYLINDTQELASVESDSLENLLKKANQESNNLYAEAFLRIVGSESSYPTSLEALKASLTALGVEPNSYQLVDGSGLSRHNLVSPLALVQTLILIAKTPQGNIYRNSLAVGGISGTLEERFKNTPLEGKIQAKTGTLSGSSALSGYFDPPNYQPLVFSIIVNQSEQEVTQLRGAIDEIIFLLNRLQNCYNK